MYRFFLPIPEDAFGGRNYRFCILCMPSTLYIYIYSTYIYIFIYLFIHIVSKKTYKFKVHPCCGWKGLGACVEMVNIVWSTIDFPNEIAVINPT